MAPYTVKCNFQLEGAKEVALVWDGQERLIEGTGTARFEFRVDNEKSFGDMTYTISIKRTEYGMSIIPMGILEARPLRLIPITPGGEPGGESTTVVSQALTNWTPEKEEGLAKLEEDLAAGRRKLPPPPAEARKTVLSWVGMGKGRRKTM
ncbi:hypothetical protein DL98DRAFT_522812 [Cadophora sp. DSE1049]|nr:hypothetical protein DL98DRAFT_522812 [Cadophora sp. DSE1049]